MPYCFSRSSVKFQGHIALKIIEFDPNWAFPDCNSSLNSPMAMIMKCCTKLETAKKRCPIVFQGHPSNFKVTRDKTSPILTQIGCFRTIGQLQLSNATDLPCYNEYDIKNNEKHVLWAQRSFQNHHQMFHDRCPEKIGPLPKKSDHWFTRTCPENMGLAPTCLLELRCIHTGADGIVGPHWMFTHE